MASFSQYLADSISFLIGKFSTTCSPHKHTDKHKHTHMLLHLCLCIYALMHLCICLKIFHDFADRVALEVTADGLPGEPWSWSDALKIHPVERNGEKYRKENLKVPLKFWSVLLCLARFSLAQSWLLVKHDGNDLLLLFIF